MLSDTNIQIQEGRGGDPLCRPRDKSGFLLYVICRVKKSWNELESPLKDWALELDQHFFRSFNNEFTWRARSSRLAAATRSEFRGLNAPLISYANPTNHPSLLLPYFDPLVNLNDSGKERSGAEGLCISNLGGTLAAGWAITLCDLAEGYLFNGKVFF